MKKQRAIIVSGYFNPIHKGYIEYLHEAKVLGDMLFVIVNNDFQRQLKGSQPFQNEDERLVILQNVKPVDKAFLSIDQDRTVRQTIEYLVKEYGDAFDFTFANGGDQNNQRIPEAEICHKLGVGLADGLGNKIQSSSWLLKKNNYGT